MNLVENLVVLYAGILFINLAISAVLWIHDKEPLYSSVFFLWLTCIFSLVSQGMLTQNDLMIAIGFTPTFLINISIVHLLSRITHTDLPWKWFYLLIFASYPLAVLFHYLDFNFTVIALPIVLAVAFPALFAGLKILRLKQQEFTISLKALLFLTIILGLHNIDFAFLRQVEIFAPIGFSIVIIIIFGLSIFAPAVVLETVKSQQSNLEELDKLKSRFFANISHEFRTPLTLIIGPVEQMLAGKFKGDINKQYRRILRNCKRLLRLINQLLDIASLEAGQMKLQASKSDVVIFLKNIVAAFESLAMRSGITLTFHAHEKTLQLFFDADKMEKILINLLSNAFKYTSEGDEIHVICRLANPPKPEKSDAHTPHPRMNQFVNVQIRDTGSGIAPERIPFIFDRFYHEESSHMSDQIGSGIGLALTKELVELHHGIISVESNLDKGTVFDIYLPMGSAHLSSSEVLEEPHQGFPSTSVEFGLVLEAFSSVEDNTEKPEVADDKKPDIVLIVEDNPDMLAYLKESLADEYSILTAENGEAGLAIGLAKIPDLIISDVMMPVMDGYALCQNLKNDERTSHIPVILLTARADAESKIAGLETGADDYLSKPFIAKELRVRVKNLIETRRKLWDIFHYSNSLDLREIAHSSKDLLFFERAIAVISAHLSEPDFETDDFGKEIGLSRSQLNRKIKAVTGQPPHMFIRTLRLKHAAKLLQHHSGNISEIAYEVGFSNPSHFAKVFKEMFSNSPSEYAARFSNTDERDLS